MFQIPVRVFNRQTRKYRTIKARLCTVTSEVTIDEANCAGGRWYTVPPGQLIYAWIAAGQDGKKLIRVLSPWVVQRCLEQPPARAIRPVTFDAILRGTIQEIVPCLAANEKRSGKSYHIVDTYTLTEG